MPNTSEAVEIRTLLTSVARVAPVHPHLVRVTLAGGDLTTFEPAGPDTFLYVLLPPAGRRELTIDRDFTWTQWAEMPDEDRPLGAYYTLRSWRPEVAEIDLLFVLHGHDGDGAAGPASSWAAGAAAGDPVALWGPRTAWSPPEGTDRYLLVADDTGLPAVAAILESLPEGTPVHVVAEVDSEEERQELPGRGAEVQVHWCYRRGAPAGTTTLVPDAVRALTAAEPLAGSPYVWGGGESRIMTAVRRHVRQDLGLAREQASLVAYWRHADHAGDPVEDDDA